jgi:hypothetical protein
MKQIIIFRNALIIGLSMTLSLLLPYSANATTMKITIEVNISQPSDEENDSWLVGPDESAPSLKVMQKVMLQNCRSVYSDFNVGSTIKAVSGSGSTVGLGKVTGVKLGKVYKKQITLYSGEDDEETTYDEYFAPCLFSGSISNLRGTSFYRFFIGSIRTEEFDSKYLAKKKWSLNLWISEISCGNYESSWSGCYED